MTAVMEDAECLEPYGEAAGSWFWMESAYWALSM
jgi:hypothetical protein